jgi:hypothetical protein
MPRKLEGLVKNCAVKDVALAEFRVINVQVIENLRSGPTDGASEVAFG